MKRKLSTVIALIFVVVTVFSACKYSPDLPETTSETESTLETTTLPWVTDYTDVTDYSSEDYREESSTDEAGSEEDSTSEQPSASEEPTSYLSPDSGVTANGYAITQVNGVTYIDGIIIANKTYSLPSDYNPGELLYDCSQAFARMKSDADDEGLSIYESSGFRSYSRQDSIYNNYCARDGKAAADRYSARPGHSEHQTGLAIDLNTIAYSFADTAEGQWVEENCSKYGFILRYPDGKEAQTGYRYEPWHIRYVGIDIAEKIYQSGLCLEEFYGITSQYE